MSIDSSVEAQAVETEVERILREVAAPLGEFPEQALLEARVRRDEVIPGLIGLLERATAMVAAGEELDTNGHWYALYLLTEFKAQSALPAILAALRLPGEGPFDLFGEDVHEFIGRALAELAGDRPEVLDDLISDRNLNQFVRWQGVSTYRLLVRDGRLTREEAVARLRPHLRQAIEDADADVALPLVLELSEYALPEPMDEIREAFRLNLVDLSMINLKQVESDLAEGEAGFVASLKRCLPTGIEDAVAEMKELTDDAGYDDDFADDSEDDDLDGWDENWQRFRAGLDEFGDDADEAADYDPYRIAPIRSEFARIGRNDACPCGSGKKYKKCCGKPQ